jgi:hypothetical protein
MEPRVVCQPFLENERLRVCNNGARGATRPTNRDYFLAGFFRDLAGLIGRASPHRPSKS